MTQLSDWIGYGQRDEHNLNKRKVRGWLREARGHVPIIDRVNYPDTGIDRRIRYRGAGEFRKATQSVWN